MPIIWTHLQSEPKARALLKVDEALGANHASPSFAATHRFECAEPKRPRRAEGDAAEACGRPQRRERGIRNVGRWRKPQRPAPAPSPSPPIRREQPCCLATRFGGLGSEG
eukprot:3540521-Prymnesium_polylepis.3